MQRIFGFAHGIRCDISTFSLVTLAEADLKPAQRIPHYDHSGSERIAAMHYLLGPESGGTAFYRHRRTGFEAITEAREAAYDAAQWEDEGTLGPPPPRYHYGDSDRYEMIGEIEARPDRLIFYRSRILHSAVIRDAAALTSDPAKGRLTINMFLSGN